MQCVAFDANVALAGFDGGACMRISKMLELRVERGCRG